MAECREIWPALAFALLAQSASAEPGSLFRSSIFQTPAGTLVEPPASALISASPFATTTAEGGSLFIGAASGSLFAPLPPRDVILRSTKGPVAMLRDLIASAEAGAAQYDAVQHGARIKPAKPPTEMTVHDIYTWIAATPGQPHAIGRYQFIPATLKRLVGIVGIPSTARFSPDVQDQLANQLLLEAGLHDFLSGALSGPDFQDNLAKIWAGLPTRNGTSHYHGYAGNKATLTRAEFDAHFARIFPG